MGVSFEADAASTKAHADSKDNAAIWRDVLCARFNAASFSKRRRRGQIGLMPV